MSTKLYIQSRVFRDEFKYYIGHTPRHFITTHKILFITDRIYHRKEEGNFFSLARDLGFATDSPLENIIRRHAGMTLTQLESQVKLLKYKDFLIYRSAIRQRLLRNFCMQK